MAQSVKRVSGRRRQRQSTTTPANYPEPVSTALTRAPAARRAGSFGWRWFAVTVAFCMASTYLDQMGGAVALVWLVVTRAALFICLFACIVALVLHKVRDR